MKQMKRMLMTILCMALAVSAAACGGKADEAPTTEETVATTEADTTEETEDTTTTAATTKKEKSTTTTAATTAAADGTTTTAAATTASAETTAAAETAAADAPADQPANNDPAPADQPANNDPAPADPAPTEAPVQTVDYTAPVLNVDAGVLSCAGFDLALGDDVTDFVKCFPNVEPQIAQSCLGNGKDYTYSFDDFDLICYCENGPIRLVSVDLFGSAATTSSGLTPNSSAEEITAVMGAPDNAPDGNVSGLSELRYDRGHTVLFVLDSHFIEIGE